MIAIGRGDTNVFISHVDMLIQQVLRKVYHGNLFKNIKNQFKPCAMGTILEQEAPQNRGEE